MKRIPIGISDFKTVIDESYLFVDKSLLIKEFWESNGQTILIPRPRRFGKTLNMSMVKYFFKDSEEDNRYLFKGLDIENHNDIMDIQGKYPVIYLSFKDEKHSSFENFNAGLRSLLSKLYQEHKYCLDSDKIDHIDKEYFNSIMNKKADIIDLSNTLKRLSEYLSVYYDKKVIILIDEYDVPIQAAYINNYYTETIEFMRNLLSGAFKDNIYLQKAMITGILRVAKESIFSGLNNLSVCTVLNKHFNSSFGFTEAEVENLASQYNINEELENIKQWYNGYNFGDITIYNPWSILNYLNNYEEGLKPYWVNTSSNDLVNILLAKGSEDVKNDLQTLIKGDSISKTID
ncbi:AAA family ATPase, partial [Clostridium frigidicarnis]